MKWSRLLTSVAKIPQEWRQDFQDEWVYVTYIRARVMALAMLTLPLIVLPVLFTALKTSSSFKFMLMAWVLGSIVVLSGVMLFSFKIPQSHHEIQNQHRYITHIYLAGIVILFNTAFSVMWSSSGINSPYLIGVFVHTTLFYYPSKINLFLYVLNFVFYLIFISAFDYSEVIKLAAYASGVIATVVAWGVATILFDSRIRDFVNKRTIELQSESLQKANEQLQLLASQDGLTQIPNRRQFDQYFDLQWKQLGRSHAFLTLLLCDIDHFKLYNDTYGHQAGDRCLKQVAEAIAKTPHREGDLVARYGGEEFVVILPNTFGEAAIAIAERICQQVRQLQILHSRSPTDYVTISIGVAWVIPFANIRPEELIATADRALYRAKQNGRDRFVHLDIETDVEPKAIII
jgi:diguanylate cyclase (GGDEF)-like protein